jgi:hypothetical protein
LYVARRVTPVRPARSLPFRLPYICSPSAIQRIDPPVILALVTVDPYTSCTRFKRIFRVA